MNTTTSISGLPSPQSAIRPAARTLSRRQTRSGLREVRRFERAQRRSLRRELALYSTESDRIDFLTMLDSYRDEQTAELRALLTR